MKIKYVQGDATLPQGDGRKIIGHVCNDAGAWGSGFVLSLSKRDRNPEREYRKWFMGDYGDWEPRLGEIQLVSYDVANQPLTWVCNMIAQELRPVAGIPLKTWALRHCLAKLNVQAKFGCVSVHMPRIGCGLGGAVWSDVEPIIASTLTDCEVTVYDL